MNRRVQELRQVLAEKGLDALLVTQPENRRYLTGFTGSAGTAIIAPQEALLLVDSRYTEQAGQQAPDFEVVRVSGRLEEDLPVFLERLGGARWAFESAHMTVSQHDKLQPVFEGVGVALEAADGLVERLRQSKDAGELALLREAVRITDEAFAHFLSWVRPGVTEREAAWEIEKYMREHGAEAISFPTIVASGSNGAMAHYRAGERPLQPGEPIVIDLGAVCQGYHADMTRTVSLTRADERFWEVYHLVLEAQQRAEAGMRAGLPGCEVDALARDFITAAGYGEYFGHGLGHGVGLGIHEPLRLSALSEDVLTVGTAVTVEPGVYIPGWGGVRIEDIVVVKEEGVEILTQSTKEPIVRVAFV